MSISNLGLPTHGVAVQGKAKKVAKPAAKAKSSSGVNTGGMPVNPNAILPRQLNTQTVNVLAYSPAHARKAAAHIAGGEDRVVETRVITKPIQRAAIESADFPQRGTRSWVTEYHIFAYGQRVPVGLNKFEYIDVEFVKGGIKEKTAAVKEAKRLSEKHQMPMMVQIVKVLEKDSPITFICEPKSEPGEYQVHFIV